MHRQGSQRSLSVPVCTEHGKRASSAARSKTGERREARGAEKASSVLLPSWPCTHASPAPVSQTVECLLRHHLLKSVSAPLTWQISVTQHIKGDTLSLNTCKHRSERLLRQHREAPSIANQARATARSSQKPLRKLAVEYQMPSLWPRDSTNLSLAGEARIEG